MDKNIIFELYHNVSSIIDDAYDELPELHNDTEYVVLVNIVLASIKKIEDFYDLMNLYGYAKTVRNVYIAHSMGYCVFNSICDAIMNCNE